MIGYSNEYGNVSYTDDVLANNIIQKVKYNVENYTGLKVSSITVNVQAVRV